MKFLLYMLSILHKLFNYFHFMSCIQKKTIRNMLLNQNTQYYKCLSVMLSFQEKEKKIFMSVQQKRKFYYNNAQDYIIILL